MKQIFKEWGGTIIIVIAVVALIGLVSLLMQPGSVLHSAFGDIVQSFVSKTDDLVNGASSGGSADEPQANEHGFYFNQPYQTMMDGALVEYVFYGDGDASMWMSMEDQHAGQYLPTGTCTYEPGAISVGGSPVSASEDGKTLSGDGISMTVNFVTESNIKYGAIYENMEQGMSLVFREDGSLELYGDGALQTTLPAGSVIVKEHTIEITAGSDSLVCPVYPDGSKLLFQDMVFCLSMPVLDVPNISLAERVLTITPVENATGYEVYIDGELICTTTEVSVDLTEQLLILIESSEISVRAVSSSGNFRESGFNTINYTLLDLETPTISLDNEILTITPVENATGYEVYIDEELIFTTSETSVDLSRKLNNDSGCIKVRAIAPGEFSASAYAYALLPGLYDANNVLLASWEQLVNDYGMDVTADYSVYIGDENHYKTMVGSPYYVLNNYSELSDGVRLVFNSDVDAVGKAAFYGCGLKSVVFNNGLASIGEYAFRDCDGLTNLEIPDGVTSIGRYAFAWCDNLRSVKISDSVSSIGSLAFEQCTNLTSVIFGENSNLLTIGTQAFLRCSRLLSIEIPNSVTSIGQQAFQECTNLNSVTIGSSVTSINNDACFGCTGLRRITFEGTMEQWNAISKGSNWNYKVPATEVVCSDGTVSLS